MDIERRDFQGVELRAGKDGEMPTIVGYAAVFEARSLPIRDGRRGEFTEVVKRGAYAKTIAEDDIIAAVDHDTDRPLGRTSKGTLKLVEDERGLKIEVKPPNTSAGRDAVENIRRGDKDGLSVGFYQGADDEWDTDERGLSVRTIKAARLRDVSLVTVAQFPDTTVALRSFQEHELEEAKRKANEEPQKLGRLKAKAALIGLELTE